MNNDITGPADDLVDAAQILLSQPTAAEVARLAYGVPDLRVCVQEEASNGFAHLLNRGSSLE